MSNKHKAEAGDGAPASTIAMTEARPTKISAVVQLLRRPEGASLQELVSTTGWQRHTTRAALTGLKKKGYGIIKEKVDGVTHYRAADAGPQ